MEGTIEKSTINWNIEIKSHITGALPWRQQRHAWHKKRKPEQETSRSWNLSSESKKRDDDIIAF